MIRALASCVLLAAIVSGCAGSHNATTTAIRPPERPSTAQRPVPADATRITGGSPSQRHELRALLRALGSTGIAKLAIGPAGHPWTSRSKDAVVLRSTPRAKDRASEWEGIVISDEFAARSARAGLPPVVASEGAFGGMRINIGYRPKLPRWSPAAVRRAIEAAARAQDATVTELRVATLNGRPAVRLQLRVDDPARFLAQRFSLVMTALPEHGAGRFVEVVDPAGNLVNVSAGAGNLGMGGTAEAYESCGPGGFSHPVGYQPRPCPFTGRTQLRVVRRPPDPIGLGHRRDGRCARARGRDRYLPRRRTEGRRALPLEPDPAMPPRRRHDLGRDADEGIRPRTGRPLADDRRCRRPSRGERRLADLSRADTSGLWP